MFHVAKGLFFERQDNGSVRIIKTYDERPPRPDNIVLDMFLPESVWCSIVASMSAWGEDGNGWYRALDFHREAQQKAA